MRNRQQRIASKHGKNELRIPDNSRRGGGRRRGSLPPEYSVWRVVGLRLPVILKLIGAGKLHSLGCPACACRLVRLGFARLALRVAFGAASRRSQRLGCSAAAMDLVLTSRAR